MALFPKAQQGRRGGGGRVAASSPPVARVTTPRPRKQGTSGRSSPRLQLTQKRTQTIARRGAGVGARGGSTGQQSSRARRGASSTGVRRTGKAGSRGGSVDGARTGTKKAAQADYVAKIVQGLQGELGTATEAAMKKLEAGCDAFVAAALDRCSSAMSAREKEIEMAEGKLREMESREASVTLPCSEMLKAIESNQVGLSAMVERCRAALDSLQQVESRKLKASLDRATGVKG